MNAETRICQNCKKSFHLTEDDLSFCKRMKVNPPALCQRCGIQYVMALRNEHVLYRGKCARCGKTTLSMYPPESPYTIYCHECWWSDSWEASNLAIDHNPTKPILEQFKNLQYKVPREALVILNSTNCDYGNHVRDSKGCYFVNLTSDSENISYSEWIAETKDCIDSKKIVKSELISNSIDVTNCYKSAYLRDCADCTECFFSYDLKGCNNCLFSSNLRNKSYCVRNKQLSKEEYEKTKHQLLNGGFTTLKNLLSDFEIVKQQALRRYANILKSNHAEGNYLEGCNRVTWCFDAVNGEDLLTVVSVGNAKSSMYSYSVGFQPVEFVFGCSVIKGGMNDKFSYNLVSSNECIYCDSLVSCTNCIACVGLKHKDYYILNKQYTKEEFERIKKQLEEKGELAQFPQASFSTFAYNESAAHSQYPLTKEAALAFGYTWKDEFPFTKSQETIQPEELPDNISDVKNTITKEVLKCQNCSRNYRIIEQELVLAKLFNLPIPRECPHCRMEARRRERLPYQLWHRKCMCAGSASDNGVWQNTAVHFHKNGHCPNEFETSYSPERKEIVYCERCYNSEVV